MKTFEWIVWGGGCVALLVGLTQTRSGRVMGRAALLFTICAAAGLALTFFTQFSKLHLLWILPVALGVSAVLAVWLGARMMRSGIQQAVANPQFQQAMRDAMKEAQKTDDHNAA